MIEADVVADAEDAEDAADAADVTDGAAIFAVVAILACSSLNAWSSRCFKSSRVGLPLTACAPGLLLMPPWLVLVLAAALWHR